VIIDHSTPSNSELETIQESFRTAFSEYIVELKQCSFTWLTGLQTTRSGRLEKIKIGDDVEVTFNQKLCYLRVAKILQVTKSEPDKNLNFLFVFPFWWDVVANSNLYPRRRYPVVVVPWQGQFVGDRNVPLASFALEERVLCFHNCVRQCKRNRKCADKLTCNCTSKCTMQLVCYAHSVPGCQNEACLLANINVEKDVHHPDLEEYIIVRRKDGFVSNL
jgi:hypothetical protein